MYCSPYELLCKEIEAGKREVSMRHFEVTVAVGGNDQTYRLKITERQGNMLDENPPPEGLQQRLELFRLLLASQHDLNIPTNDILQMHEVFDDEMLDRYLNNFYGNGSWGAPHWCVGIEPRIDSDSCTDGIRSVRIWDKLGGGNFIARDEYWNLYDPEAAQAVFANHQPTWDPLIKIHLKAFENLEADAGTVNEYRMNSFLKDGQICLLESLPLPLQAHQQDCWMYDGCTNLPHLKNLDVYTNHFLPIRINHIFTKARYWTPKAILFYWWPQRDFIGHAIFEQAKVALRNQLYQRAANPNTIYEYKFGANEVTKFFIIKHPARAGSDDFFWHIGHLIGA